MEKFQTPSGLLLIVLILSCVACSPPSNDGPLATEIAGEIYSKMTTEAISEVETEVINTPTPENKILFEDDFSGSTSPYDYKESDLEIKQEAGILRISVYKQDWMAFSFVPGYEYEDTTVNIDVTAVEGDPEDGYGVICRATDTSSYTFEITNDGFFSIWLWEEQDGYTPLVEQTRSSAIDTGLNKTNRISVTCSSEQLVLVVNERMLANITDNSISQGDIYLFARNDLYSNIQIHIDNLEITEPESFEAASMTETETRISCLTPGSISDKDSGNQVEVCGEITNWGDVPCPDCVNGGYSYLTLDHSFTILSYEWVFNNDWIGDCVRVSDTVEMLGNDPIFVYGKGEGYAGSDCNTGSDGIMTCSQGDYFGYYSGCK